MPSLTVAEKNHWRDRIAARITRAVEAVKSRHPALFDRVRRQAHAEALRTLGLAEPYAELEAIRAEEAGLARRRTAAQRAMLATLRGVPVDEVSEAIHLRYGGELPLPSEAAEAIARRQSAHQDRLLAEDPVGREVARPGAEEDGLLDTVWLAMSPDAIRQLWAKVGDLLGDEPTRPERDAPAIVPREEGRCRDDLPIEGDAGPAGGRRPATAVVLGRCGPKGGAGPGDCPRPGRCRRGLARAG